MPAAADSVRLTPLRWWEIEELLPIERDLFGAESWTASMFWAELAQYRSRWYRIARDPAGQLLGYIGVCIYDAEQAWIQTVAVRREAQRAGLGGTLISAALRHAEEAGVTRLALEVRADNGPAQRLYGRHGFEVIGVRRGYYQPSGVDALVMARDIVTTDRQ